MHNIKIQPRTTRENLDKPLDKDIQMIKGNGIYRLTLFVDGECASWTNITAFQQQIGSETITMGGIGGVGTSSPHRYKGYSRIVMENSLRWMKKNNFDVAMLYGINSFYHKFGYAQSFPDISFSLAVRDAEMVKGNGYKTVNYNAKYLAAILKMYHRNNLCRTGPARRNQKQWKPFSRGVRWDSKSICKVLLNEKKKPVGYFVYDTTPLEPKIIEVGFSTHKVFADILQGIVQVVWEQRLEQISFLLSEDDEFMAFCQPLGLKKIVEYRQDGGGMVRMINLAQTIKKISPLLNSRIKTRESLNIKTNLESVGISWEGGKCNVHPQPLPNCQGVQMPQWALAQLIYGYRGVSTLLSSGTIKASKHCVDILNELFPTTQHFFYSLDKF